MTQKTVISRSVLDFKAILNILETSVEKGEVSLREATEMFEIW